MSQTTLRMRRPFTLPESFVERDSADGRHPPRLPPMLTPAGAARGAEPGGSGEPWVHRPSGSHRLGIDLRVAAGLAGSVARLLRHPLSLAEARGELARRLAQREQDFLALARDAIYGHPASVYRRLLHHVGCELGDLDRLVRREGLEEALRQRLRQGVHMTVDEAKGRRPVVRGA